MFRIFDAMNDVRNMTTAIDAALGAGKTVAGTICYTISPVHSVDYFVSVAEELAGLGVQIICLKDMGGLLRPYVAAEIVAKLKARIPLPVHVHSHCTAGLAPLTYMLAIEAGADNVDTALSPLAHGTSQPATEAIVDMSPSVTDGGWFGHARIPAAIFGPGELAHAHAVDESVDPDQLVTFAQVLARFIANWCNMPRRP